MQRFLFLLLLSSCGAFKLFAQDEEPQRDSNELAVFLTADSIFSRLQFQGDYCPLPISFKGNTEKISSESKDQIRELSAMLENHPELKLFVQVYSDNQGGPVGDNYLAEHRARAIVKAASSKAVSSLRMKPFGKKDEVRMRVSAIMGRVGGKKKRGHKKDADLFLKPATVSALRVEVIRQ